MRALLAITLLAVSCGASSATQLQPFFDSLDNPVPVDSPFGQKLDRTPPHKRISPFGNAVLRLCGQLGDPVSRESVHRLFEDTQWNWALDPIHKDLYPGIDKATFVAQLTHLWSVSNGFRHIFCGEPEGKRLSGLHYRGRFAQLYRQGSAGLLPHDRGADEVVPGVIYAIPLQYRWNGRWKRVAIKSYPYSLDAHDILYHATAAARKAGTGPGKTVCLYRIAENGQAAYENIVVIKGDGLLTFYPDATPLRELKACAPRGSQWPVSLPDWGN